MQFFFFLFPQCSFSWVDSGRSSTACWSNVRRRTNPSKLLSLRCCGCIHRGFSEHNGPGILLFFASGAGSSRRRIEPPAKITVALPLACREKQDARTRCQRSFTASGTRFGPSIFSLNSGRLCALSCALSCATRCATAPVLPLFESGEAGPSRAL